MHKPYSLSTLAKIAVRLPPVVSTGTEQTDILEQTNEEQEVDATGLILLTPVRSLVYLTLIEAFL